MRFYDGIDATFKQRSSVESKVAYADVFIALSGGLDSTTILMDIAWSKHVLGRSEDEIIPVVFTYGNKASNAELQATDCICKLLLGKSPELINLPNMDNLSDKMSVITKDPKNTIYPFRNGVLLSHLTYLAARYGSTRQHPPYGTVYPQVVIGVHKGDITDYPDTRPEFTGYMKAAIGFGTEHHVELLAPFQYYPKEDIVKHAVKIPRWREVLALTSSCYHAEATSAGIKICGECPSCLFRAKAFKEAGYEDPIMEVQNEVSAHQSYTSA